MSFDLGVRYPQQRIGNKEAGELYVRLCAGDTSGVLPHLAIDAFYTDLTGKHPEIDTIPEGKIGDYDYCPWSCKLDRSPGHVIMSCVWSKATYVDRLVQDLARKHGLAVYDPQDDEVIYPDGSTGSKGMSRSTRWVLGFFALLFAAIFVYSEQLAPSRAPLAVYIFAVFCGLMALACFAPRWSGPVVRILGFVVFLTFASNFVSELFGEPEKTYAGNSEPHWLNAILGLIVFGLPGLYVAVRGKYPNWGGARHSLAEQSRLAMQNAMHTTELQSRLRCLSIGR